MSLFKSKEEKEAKKQAKVEKFLHDKGIDDLDEETSKQIQTTGLQGMYNTFADFAVAMDMNSFENKAMDGFNGLLNQNWILIKQNDDIKKQNAEIIELLKKQNEGK